ncbi:hypothetical protein GOBAR_DD00469 [Gossypium barbadense]|nr:hypothetical protein GOBAR_DD00469 [Gossypium barbadense]
MSDKQAHLNGAYYGPSIPPPTRTYHRPGRGSGSVFIFWLIFRPNKVKFHVTDVQLTQFNLTSNNTLHYNLALNMTIRNPNRRIGIYYDRIEARAYYEDQRLDTETLTPFYQGHKNTSYLNPVFVGQQFVRLGADETSEFNEDRVNGVYDIDVKLYLRIRFKLGRVKTGRFKPRISCDLKVPLNTGNGSFGGKLSSHPEKEIMPCFIATNK